LGKSARPHPRRPQSRSRPRRLGQPRSRQV